MQAKHIIETRTAVNAICTYAGTSVCPSLAFSGSDLIEAQVKTQIIAASHFSEVKNQIMSLRAAIGASAAVFRDPQPALGITVRVIHMEDLWAGAR